MALVRITFIFLNLVSVIILLPGNLFIIAVIILDFLKNRRLLLSVQLIFGISAFIILHELVKAYVQCIHLFELNNNDFDKITAHTAMYANLCTLWLYVLLSIHFCLKIVNFNHWFYICLQRTFPKLFPWIIITFVLGCFFLIFYFALETNQDCLLNTTSNTMFMMKNARCSWSLMIFTAISVLGTFLCSVSGSTILFSLFKHMKRIQENTEGSRSPNMDAHIRAIKTVTTLLIANILVLTSVFVMTFCEKKWLYLVGFLLSTCHIVSSYFLIKGTKILDKTRKEILNLCSCFRSQKD